MSTYRQCGGVTREVLAIAQFARDRVLALRTSTRRRVFPAALSVHLLLTDVGDPVRAGGGASAAGIGPAAAAWTAPALGTSRWDWHLRRELMARLLEQVDQHGHHPGAHAAEVLLVWTRPGPPEREDDDAAWWAAARSASADVRVQVQGLVVVTRWGWLMLPEGPSRRWQRLRDHHARHAAAAPATDVGAH